MFAGHNRGKHYRPGVGYIVGKPAVRIMIAAVGRDIKCPYCETFSNTENAIRSCPKCGRVWFQKRNGDYIFVA